MPELTKHQFNSMNYTRIKKIGCTTFRVICLIWMPFRELKTLYFQNYIRIYYMQSDTLFPNISFSFYVTTDKEWQVVQLQEPGDCSNKFLS